MRIAPCLLALALIAPMAGAAAPALAAPHHAPARPGATVIRDPQMFVAGVYARLRKGGDYQPPEDIYTPRLDALWASMNRDAKGEVPRIEFLFWINGQDGDLSEVELSAASVEQRPQNDRRIIIAKFTNSGQPEELHFYFERAKAGWKLDDVRSVKTEPWTLSLLLKYGGEE